MDQPGRHDGSTIPPRVCAHGLEITVGHNDGHLVLHVEGEVDMESSQHFSEFLAAALDQSASVVVDLRGVGFMDSIGLGVLIGARNKALAVGRELKVRDPAPATLRVLQVSGVDQVLTIEMDGQG